MCQGQTRRWPLPQNDDHDCLKTDDSPPDCRVHVDFLLTLVSRVLNLVSFGRLMSSVNNSGDGITMGFRPSCEGPKASRGQDFDQALRSKECRPIVSSEGGTST